MSQPETVNPPPRPPRGSIWIGPFVGVPQANRAINAAGGTLVAFGGLPLVSFLTTGQTGGAFMIAVSSIMAAIFIMPGVFLLLSRSPLAAGVASGVTLVLLVLMGFGLFSLVLAGNTAVVLPGVISGGVMFGSVAYLCWRARGAARFLRPLKDPTVFE